MHQSSIYVTMLALSASVTVQAENPDAAYLNYPTYSGEDLELTVDDQGTRWRLWSPKAEAARVILYDSDRNTPAVDTLEMTGSEGGTWVAGVPRIEWPLAAWS